MSAALENQGLCIIINYSNFLGDQINRCLQPSDPVNMGEINKLILSL